MSVIIKVWRRGGVAVCAERGRGLETVRGMSLPAKSGSGPVRAVLPYVVTGRLAYLCAA